MNKTNSLSGVYLSGADGMRAFACLAVVFHHLSQFLSSEGQASWIQEMHAFLLVGNSGVSVFFVLSGYLLAFPFWSKYLEGHPFPSLKSYTVRRAARIMPGFYVAVLVSTLLTVLFSIPTDHFWLRLAAGVTFTSGFHYITLFPNEVNGPLWSISFEVFCYMLLPLFMFGLYRWSGARRTFGKGLLYWLGVLALILVFNQLVHLFFATSDEGKGWEYGWIGGAKSWMPNYNPVGFFGHFAIGILAAGAAAKLLQRPERTNGFARIGGFDAVALLGWIGAIAVLWLARHLPEFSWSLQNQPFYFPLFAMLIAASLCAASRARWAARLLDNPFFKFTSKVSFGLYIWHFVILGVSSITWAQDMFESKDFGMWAIVSAVVIVVSYVFATLSYYLVEKPVLDWSRGKRRAPLLFPWPVSKQGKTGA